MPLSGNKPAKPVALTLPPSHFVPRRTVMADRRPATDPMPEKILHYRQVVKDRQSDALKEIEAQLVLLGNEFLHALESETQKDYALLNGEDVAMAIKRQTETLNFALGYDIATSLCDYLKQLPAYSLPAHMIVCRHIAIMHMAIRNRITGSDDSLERRMLADLRAIMQQK